MIKAKAVTFVEVSSGMLLGMLLGLTFIVGNSAF
jgi:hypothetical protein